MSAVAVAPPWLRGMRAAFAFLSRIPVGGHPYRAEDWRWAPAHFPLVGIVVGAATAAVYALARPLGSSVAAVLALLVSIALTGALHEDGLADSADALGGGHGRDQILVILKDSRIGTYGAVALVLSILLRAVCIAALDEPACLVLVACLARAAPVWQLAMLPYVSTGPTAKGQVFSKTGARQVIVATAWAGVAAFGLSAVWPVAGAELLVLVAVAAMTTALLSLWFLRRVGGITGDLLGATEQACEAAALVALLVLGRAGE